MFEWTVVVLVVTFGHLESKVIGCYGYDLIFYFKEKLLAVRLKYISTMNREAQNKKIDSIRFHRFSFVVVR